MLGPLTFAGAGSAGLERDLAYCLRIQIAVNAASRPYAAPNVRYWGNSVQKSILAPDDLSANDPTATFQHRKELSRSIRIIIGQNPYRRRSHGPLKWAVSTIGRSGLGHTKLEPSANS
jgi:hypothetical protein